MNVYNRAATSERYMFHNNPQKLRKTIRRSTCTYVVLKKLAIGQTLYESQIRPNSSYDLLVLPRILSRSSSTYIPKVLHDQRDCLALQQTD